MHTNDYWQIRNVISKMQWNIQNIAMTTIKQTNQISALNNPLEVPMPLKK